MANPMLKLFVGMHVGLYRMSGGKIGGGMMGGKVLLLTTTGNKTGKQRTVPVMYFEKDGHRYVVASNGGAPTNPGWFKNLEKKADVTVQVDAKRFGARAEVVAPEARAKLWEHVVATMKQFGEYEKKTVGKREIPIVEIKEAAAS